MIEHELDLIEFPDAPDFISEPPRFTLEEMITLCHTLLPYWNQQRYSKPEPDFVGEPFKLLVTIQPKN